ncbi:MAG TPA: OmpH family outer membrane protein [Mucilaginibacter sp.]|jgi:outer membrane protein|nr:OmpH family outer membrane protein [Mucilaginibacter sp.]
MKKSLIIALLFCMVFAGITASAQVKIGYINLSQLVQLMPETKTIQENVNAYSKQFLDQLTTMDNEFKARAADFQKNQSTMTDAVRSAKQAELADMQKRMQDYSNDSQQKVEAKSAELAKPLLDKMRAAVAQVAKEKGFSYVINTAQTDLIVSPPGDDLTADVKAKLGIK